MPVPALIVVVDTEEEFDWSAPIDRAATGIGHTRRLPRLQALCETWNIRPVYVVDYPVASQEPAIGVLGPLGRAGRALIGAHLHPWVSPPHEEDVTTYNSFLGNLPARLERDKVSRLAGCIAENLGAWPLIYKAGRYGIGPNSFAILEELGFLVDLSPAPPFDFRGSGGPDFSRRGLAPRWEGPDGTVLSIPNTGALIGRVPSNPLYRAAASLTALRVPGILARLGVVERLRLSPEGHAAADLERMVRWLHARGEELFVLSLHSTSLEPGHTPYVRSEADLDALLDTMAAFFRFFMTDLGGIATDPLEVRARFQPAASGSARWPDHR